MTARSVTIVGAALAGLRGAEALRRDGFDGPITMVGEEAHLPYDRPPLSKQFLSGEWPADRTSLIGSAQLSELDVAARLSTRAESFELSSRVLELSDGERLVVDGLMITTGSRARVLPGGERMTGLHVLRSLDDAVGLRADLDRSPSRVVVVGAGFIGAEVASTIKTLGIDVTVVEAGRNPLGRVLGDEIGAICGEIHREQGVDLRTGVGVDAIEGAERVEAVRLSDGSRVNADVVVVGIGAIPNSEWLRGSGLTVDDGILCDETCLAAPGVVAAGDVARWPNRRFGEVMRVEHWDNAIEQATHAALRLMHEGPGDEATEFTPVPWFWSDQYDRKIQMAGRVRPGDRSQLVTGSFDERRFAVLFGRSDRLMGVVGFNRPRHVMRYKSMITDGVSFADAVSADV